MTAALGWRDAAPSSPFEEERRGHRRRRSSCDTSALLERSDRTTSASSSASTSRRRTAPASSTRRPATAATTTRSCGAPASRWTTRRSAPSTRAGYYDVERAGVPARQARRHAEDPRRRREHRRPRGARRTGDAVRRPCSFRRSRTLRTPIRTAGAARTRSSSGRRTSGSSTSGRCATARWPRSAAASTWIPSYSENRIGAMVDNRLEWTISRQRRWGSPITFLRCTDCKAEGRRVATSRASKETSSEKEEKEREDFFERVRETFREHGAERLVRRRVPPVLLSKKILLFLFVACLLPLRRDVLREAEGHPRRLVRLRRLARGGPPLGRLRPRGPVHGAAAGARHVPRGPRPAPRLVPVVPPHVGRAHGPRALRRRPDARVRRRGRRPQDVEVARQHDRAAGPPQDRRAPT